MITVEPLSPARLADWLHFFDHVAFVDNPEWAACYCQCFVYPGPRTDWDASTAEENRAAAIAGIESGRAEGLLAYEDGKVVGWCQAARPAAVPALVDALGLADAPPEDAAVVTCFLVAPGARRRGVARALLNAAIGQARARGASAFYGYPHLAPDDRDAERFCGPASLYTELGFVPVARTQYRQVVRLEL